MATQTNVIEHADAVVMVIHGTDSAVSVDRGTDLGTQTTFVEHANASVRVAILTGADMATQTNTFDVNTNDVQGFAIDSVSNIFLS